MAGRVGDHRLQGPPRRGLGLPPPRQLPAGAGDQRGQLVAAALQLGEIGQARTGRRRPGRGDRRSKLDDQVGQRSLQQRDLATQVTPRRAFGIFGATRGADGE
jgi:hypothetical protein